MNNKFFAFLLSIICLFAMCFFVACSGEGGGCFGDPTEQTQGNPDDKNPDDDNPTEPTDDPPDEPTDDPSVDPTVDPTDDPSDEPSYEDDDNPTIVVVVEDYIDGSITKGTNHLCSSSAKI